MPEEELPKEVGNSDEGLDLTFTFPGSRSDKTPKRERNSPNVQQRGASQDVDDIDMVAADKQEERADLQFSFFPPEFDQPDDVPNFGNFMTSGTSQPHISAPSKVQQRERSKDIYHTDKATAEGFKRELYNRFSSSPSGVNPPVNLPIYRGSETPHSHMPAPTKVQQKTASKDVDDIDVSQTEQFAERVGEENHIKGATAATMILDPPVDIDYINPLPRLAFSSRDRVVRNSKSKEPELRLIPDEFLFVGKGKGKSVVEERNDGHETMPSEGEKRSYMEI